MTSALSPLGLALTAMKMAEAGDFRNVVSESSGTGSHQKLCHGSGPGKHSVAN